MLTSQTSISTCKSQFRSLPTTPTSRIPRRALHRQRQVGETVKIFSKVSAIVIVSSKFSSKLTVENSQKSALQCFLWQI